MQTYQTESLGFAQNGSSVLDSKYKLPVGNDPQRFSLYSDREGSLGGAYEAKLLKKNRSVWSNRLSIGRYFKPFLH